MNRFFHLEEEKGIYMSFPRYVYVYIYIIRRREEG